MERKEAIEVIKKNYPHVNESGSQFETALRILIPELKESEDERMLRVLREGFNILDRDDEWYSGITNGQILTWLEKQGEQQSKLVDFDYNANDSELQEATYFIPNGVHAEIDGNKVIIKRGEQKPDKVEPKFHEGEWVIFNENRNSAYQVEKIDNYRYYLRHYLGGTLSVPFDSELIRKWTVEDIKAGDVLVFGDHGRFVVGIVSYVNKTTDKIDVSCLLENSNFKVGNYYNLDTIKPHPATKRQRDLLFQKMKEAGYEWNAEKKELKKIEQKPWSEDDEKMFNSALWHIKNSCGNGGKNSGEFEVYNWLKSLKDRCAWKPSVEQMNALNYVVNLMASSESPKENDYYYNVFKDLREQLKKLRGE